MLSNETSVCDACPGGRILVGLWNSPYAVRPFEINCSCDFFLRPTGREPGMEVPGTYNWSFPRENIRS